MAQALHRFKIQPFLMMMMVMTMNLVLMMMTMTTMVIIMVMIMKIMMMAVVHHWDDAVGSWTCLWYWKGFMLESLQRLLFQLSAFHFCVCSFKWCSVMPTASSMFKVWHSVAAIRSVTVLQSWEETKTFSTLLFVSSLARKLLSLIHIWRCRRLLTCRSRWSPYH